MNTKKIMAQVGSLTSQYTFLRAQPIPIPGGPYMEAQAVTLGHISKVPLQPRKVGFFCHSSDSTKKGKTWHGNECDTLAVAWLVASDGTAVSRLCAKCLERVLKELGPEGWTQAPIYHDQEDQTVWIPRPIPPPKTGRPA